MDPGDLTPEDIEEVNARLAVPELVQVIGRELEKQALRGLFWAKWPIQVVDGKDEDRYSYDARFMHFDGTIDLVELMRAIQRAA